MVEDLQRFRIDAGDVSYSELALRIGQRRESKGFSPAAARVARSTVFDAFQLGRRRMNAALVEEIVLALGSSENEARAWRERSLAARGQALGHPVRTAPASSEAAIRRSLVVLIIVGCIGINLFGGTVAVRLHLPLFLDMIGTAAAAIVLGPWRGALVGLVTNVLGAMTSTPETIFFALVNIAGALVWGYGFRRFGAGRSLIRFLGLTCAVALACTIVAVPITVLLYDGVSGHPTDSLILAWRAAEGLWVAVFSANFLASFVDKLLAGCAGLLLAVLLMRRSPLGVVVSGINAGMLPRPVGRSIDSRRATRTFSEEG
ncbi:MAG: ECF transporter S component [Pseudolysinimonas sp.]|uniref:ECF transporter S component n=1 Tax=Pseudolysinimonas sp. TaxID=2680009 RepID=UPI003266A0CF